MIATIQAEAKFNDCAYSEDFEWGFRVRSDKDPKEWDTPTDVVALPHKWELLHVNDELHDVAFKFHTVVELVGSPDAGHHPR